jgi:hypothetical protein
MSLPQEPGDTRPALQPRQPTRELLLAQALDACIRAERREPGSARAIIELQPAWARADLHKLLGLAGSLDAAATNAVMSETFRASARARLMARIGADAAAAPAIVALPSGRLSAVPSNNGAGRSRGGGSRLRSKWAWRGCASLFAAMLGVTATLTASASALPGEPLYGLKQAQEDLRLRMASDDQARAVALLRSADARLDETSRLLQQGRTGEAVQTTLRYDQTVERATTTFIVTIEDTPADPPAAVHIDTSLSQQQEHLQALLLTAPETARADLREALVATERSRALVADPRPVERALGRPSNNRGAVAANVPTPALEELPTTVPTTVLAKATAVVPSSVLAQRGDDHAFPPVTAQTQDVLRPAPVVTEPDPRGPVRLTTGTASGTSHGTTAPTMPGVASDRPTGRLTLSGPPAVSVNGRGEEGDSPAPQPESEVLTPAQAPTRRDDLVGTRPVVRAVASRSEEETVPTAVPVAPATTVRQALTQPGVPVAQSESRGNVGGGVSTQASDQVARPATPNRDAGESKSTPPTLAQATQAPAARAQATPTAVPQQHRGTPETADSNKAGGQVTKPSTAPAPAGRPKSGGDATHTGGD